MSKRGQVALFIILGIVVILVIGIIYFQRGTLIREVGTTESNERFVSSQLEPIKTYVQNCVNDNALEGIILIGKQGGYYDPVKYESLGSFNVSYACYKINENYVNILPLISEMNNELKQYMSSSKAKKDLDKCIDDFKFFRNQGLDVKSGILSFDTNILEDKVTISINYPLEVSRGDYTATLRNMFTEIPVGLGKAHKIAVQIANKECNNEEFDYDSLGLNEHLVTSSVQGYNNNNIVYLKTIPTTTKEISIDFNFIIQK